MNSWLLIGIALSFLLALSVLAALGLRRGLLSAEASRKLVHLGMGLVCISFPFVFDSVIPVQVLAVVAVVSLLLLRLSPWKASAGAALFSVERVSVGELLFPVAVAWIFTLGFEKPLIYVISLLLLSLADTAGAIAGSRFGKRLYQTRAGRKSVEGSCAFYVTALMCTAVPLLIWSDYDLLHIGLVALTVSLFTTAVEGASGRGMDNLLIPIGSFLLLDYYLGLESFSLLWRLGILLGLLALLLGTRRRHTFDGGALLCALLFGFAAASMGGVFCLIATLVLFGRHLWAQCRMKSVERVQHSLDVIFFIAIPSLFWLTLSQLGQLGRDSGEFGFIAVLSIIIGMLHVGTQSHLGRGSSSWLKGLVLSALTMIPALFVEVPAIYCLAPLGISLVTSFIYFRWRRGPDEVVFYQWAKLGVLASVASVLLLLILPL